MIPRELVEGDLRTMEPVGSGPYMQESYQFQVRYEYVRNPTWREADQGLPYIDRRIRLPLLDSTAIESGFRAQQADVMGSGDDRTSVPADMADRLIRDLGDQIEVTEYTSLNLFTWNMASWPGPRPFDDIRVREAFYRNFNGEQFIELVADGWGVKTTGQMSQGLEPYVLDESETAEFKRFDRQEARQLLEAAGWDFDHTWRNSTLANPVNISAAEVFSEQLRQIGVHTSIESRPAAEWIQDVSRTGNYDFCGGVGHPPQDSPARQMRLHHSNTQTHHQAFNIRDTEVDAMIEEAERTVDREANIELVKETQRELLRRYSHMSYHYTPVLRELRWSYVRDWEFSQLSAPMFRTEAWMDV
jgi:ABC-type transport system substrate-binding protein